MGETFGKYEMVRHLATGGMAEIWIARQSGAGGFQREIAIKRILPHLAREKRFVAMFLDEARIASALRHPNIVQIYELGEERGEYFIAMEYIEGADLADMLDEAEARNVEFPIAVSVRIIADILAALDFAHEFSVDERPLKIVHRDVSPHNVLIGRDGIIKLVDFGIAHAVERHAKTETGLVKGKLSYMAPEQVEQGTVDRRADIFAAGALLYELLTLKTPFGRELAAINAILNEDPQDPRLLRPDIPDELVPIIFKALEKDPDGRYQTAHEMHEELERVLRSFNRYVSAKHVARFAERLLAGEALEGYDDISQAIPRPVARRAFVEATTQVDTPVGLEVALEDAPTLEDQRFPATLRMRENLRDDEAPQTRARSRWLVPTVAGIVAVVIPAMLMVAFSGEDEDTLPSASAAPKHDRYEERVGSPQSEAMPEPVRTMELEVQYLDGDDGELVFEEGESTLLDLEEAVDTLSPSEVERMLVANYERTDEQYLWSVRGPHLLGEFTDAPGPIDPGDPAAPFVLGLEQLDSKAVKSKPRKKPRRVKKRVKRSVSKAAAPVVSKPETTDAPGTSKEPAPEVATQDEPPKPKTAQKKPKKTSRRDDLRIIDKAVPY